MSDKLGLLDACKAIQNAVMSRNDGTLRQVVDVPPEYLSAYPFIVIHVGDGGVPLNTPTDVRGDHDLTVEVHMARKDMSYDYITATMAVGLVVMSVYAAQRNPGELHPIERIENISYRPAPMRWGGIDTVGYDMTIEGCKIRVEIPD